MQLKEIYFMSRQYPDHLDIKYFENWAESKIIETTRSDRPSNFINVANLTRLVSIFLNLAPVNSSWLSRRTSDIHYALSEMQNNEECTEKFKQAEISMLETLAYIAEFYEENGFTSFGNLTEASTGIVKVWRTPSRWLKEHSEELDSFQ